MFSSRAARHGLAVALALPAALVPSLARLHLLHGVLANVASSWLVFFSLSTARLASQPAGCLIQSRVEGEAIVDLVGGGSHDGAARYLPAARGGHHSIPDGTLEAGRHLDPISPTELSC